MQDIGEGYFRQADLERCAIASDGIFGARGAFASRLDKR